MRTAGYTKVPNSVLLHKNLTPLEKVCFAVLLSHCNVERDGYYTTWVLNTALGKELGCSPRQARRCVARLQDVGLIESAASSNDRIITIPSDLDGMHGPEKAAQDRH
jgi:DNA-binding MarR family transcriptional regulator